MERCAPQVLVTILHDMLPSSRSVHLSVCPLQLTLRDPFSIAHGTSLVRDNLLVTLRWGLLMGVGEVAVVPYLGETAPELTRALEHPGLLSHLTPSAPLEPERALESLRRPLSPAALAGLDMALHDLWGRRLGRPLHQLWGLAAQRAPATSFTIAMDDDDQRYRRRVRAARGFGLLKLKLGSGQVDRDLELARLAHEEAPGSRLCVDANGGWSPAQTLEAVAGLAPLDPLFIEQPIPADLGVQGWRAVRQGLGNGGPPLLADESFQDVSDLQWLHGLADGINVKLSKVGGLAPAAHAMRAARQRGMKVLLGCMVESSLGVTAAAHLAPLCDLADLDGHLLLSDDPFVGVEVDGRGHISLPARAGLGVEHA